MTSASRGGNNQHVAELAREGLITGAGLLANYPYAEAASQLLRSAGLRDIGLHLNLSDGYPLSPLPRGAALLNRQGQFRDRIWLFWRGWQINPRLYQQIRGELAAQIERFRSWGIIPTHLSSHCHFHTVPALTTMVAELAAEYDIPRIRAPHVRAFLSPMRARFFRQPRAGVLIDGQREHLTAVESWLGQPPHRCLEAIAECAGNVELIMHPGIRHDPEMPPDFRYSTGKRARESDYLRRLITSYRSNDRGIELALATAQGQPAPAAAASPARSG